MMYRSYAETLLEQEIALATLAIQNNTCSEYYEKVIEKCKREIELLKGLKFNDLVMIAE